MLSCLRIQQLAIIEESEIDFGMGLNILSGETGSGKSILIHALQLVLGGRARADMIRTGADEATVEALFELEPDSPILSHEALAGNTELIIRRVVKQSGRSRAYVNGKLTTLSQLHELAAGLVDISSQHEHHSLTQPSAHLRYLDAYGGLEEQTGAVGEAVRTAMVAHRALGEWEEQLRVRSEREDLLRYQVQEIEEVDPKAGEEESLEVSVSRLRHGAELAQVSRSTESDLYSGSGCVVSVLSRALSDLERLVHVDPELQPLVSQLESARAEIEDVGAELGQYSRSIRWEPHLLEEGEERLRALRRLRRKYGATVEAVIERYEAIREELLHFDDAEGHRSRLEQERDRARQVAGELALGLSEARKGVSTELGRGITAELQTLGMGGAEVLVEVSPLVAEGNQLQVAGARLAATGLDRVELLIAPNPGEEPRPIAKIASGGELSRALLAIKKILAGVGPGGLYVFDEVDTGVGGAVAEVIGRKLDALSRHRQVVCITHLPQIAAFADRHLLVSKGTEDGRTRSVVRLLSESQRSEEIARMLGGVAITATTRQAAAELLSVAADQVSTSSSTGL
jgi:DNA repair protein RecN (Recombination protein N)